MKQLPQRGKKEIFKTRLGVYTNAILLSLHLKFNTGENRQYTVC